MNKNNSLSDSLGQTITPFLKNMMPFLLTESTFLQCTNLMGISRSFNKLITPLLKEPKQQIKSIYTIIDFEKERFQDSPMCNIHLLIPQAELKDLKKSTFVKELTLEALSVLYSEMKKYYKFLYSSSIELVCKEVDIALLEDPVSEEVGIVSLEDPVSFKSLNELTLTDLFVYTRKIAILGTLRCLTTLSLLDFKCDDKKLSLEDLKITKLIMIIDISKISKRIIPPSDLEFFESTLFLRNPCTEPENDTLTIPFIHCTKLQSL
jgi:hypothetical protein